MLREYQREDVEFLKAYKCMACFNQQRTGKTPTTITAMVERGIDKLLVICPASAIYPWAAEIRRWSNLNATVLAGTPKQKNDILDAWVTGAMVMSYQNAQRNLPALKEAGFEGFILDEAHRIKNRTTQNAKTAFELASVIPYRIAATGTPAPNKPEEVWSILHFLYPEKFKSYWNFIDEFFDTMLMSNRSGQRYKEITGIKPSKSAELIQMLMCISTQRKRRDVMEWLPEKERQRVLLPPNALQTRYLQELKDYFETEGIVTQGVLDRLIRYRQICLHPGLLNLRGASPKLDWIQDYLSDYPDTPTIIFSKFTSFLKMLSEKLEVPHGMIIGETPAVTRAKLVEDFQSSRLKLLLINIDAGKEALTLDRAEAIIFTDKFPPVGDIEQAEDRFVATTVEKASKPHLIYELILQGTYDEAIYDLLERRASSVDAINNFEKYMKGEFNGTNLQV